MCAMEQLWCLPLYTSTPPAQLEQVTGNKTPPPPLSFPPPPPQLFLCRVLGLQSLNLMTTCLFSNWPPPFTNQFLTSPCVYVEETWNLLVLS